MGISLTYGQVMIFVTILWIIYRVIAAFRNKRVDWKNECKILTVYASIAFVTRLVYFPLFGDQDKIVFIYTTKNVRNRLNLIPFVSIINKYQDWDINFFGNIAMFIPVGLSFPFCYKQLNNIGKVTLAGVCYSLLIELSQMFVFGRGTDIDDLITNTLGALIGGAVYFAILHIKQKSGKTS